MKHEISTTSLKYILRAIVRAEKNFKGVSVNEKEALRALSISKRRLYKILTSN